MNHAKPLIWLFTAAFLVGIVLGVTFEENTLLRNANVTYNYTTSIEYDNVSVSGAKFTFNNDVVTLSPASGQIDLQVIAWNTTFNNFTVIGTNQNVTVTVTRGALTADTYYNESNITSFNASTTSTTFHYNFTSVEEEPSPGGGGGVGIYIPEYRPYSFTIVTPEIDDVVEWRLVLTGDTSLIGGDDYQVFVTSYVGEVLTNIPGSPLISIRTPLFRTAISGLMEYVSPGVYSFNAPASFLLLDGEYETVITASLFNQGKTVKESFTILSAPTRLSIDLIDNQPPVITCRTTVINEGTFSQEYRLRNWFTTISTNDFNNSNQKSSESKLLAPGEEYFFDESYTAVLPGSYWCKGDVDYGGRVSAASEQVNLFNVDEEGPPTELFKALLRVIIIPLAIAVMITLLIVMTQRRRKE